MASLAVAVLGAAVGSAVKGAADLGVNFIQKKLMQWAEFDVDIGEINRHLELKLANREQQLLQEVINPSEEQKISFAQMVDLAYDIEDCLDQIQRCGVIGRFVLHDKAKDLRRRLENADQGRQNNNGNPGQSTTTSLPPANASSSTSPHQPVKLVGIDKPMEEILELVNDIEGQQEQKTTKVICIVGFSGTGKSKLAEEVFNCTDLVSRFPCRGRVIASQYKDNPNGLLMALIKQINPQETDHVKNITDHLINKRYFIVLDDIIDKEQWFSIRTAFPDTTGGLIIVTTKDQTVAIACRNDGNNGFLYNMRTLNETLSIDEYLGAFLESINKAKFEEVFRLFANKCDGHPLSLASMTKYLLGKQKFTINDFRDFWNDLGDSMKSDNVFRELEQILVDSYRTLDCSSVRAFLLYLCLFPNGHPIRRKRLTRRRLAEGYSTQLDSYLQKLVEKNVVRTLESSKDATVKCCRVHGIIHGFMVHMSKPTKFIASAGSVNNIDTGKYRHLYFKGGELEQPDVGPSVNSQDKKNSFRAHSLTICGRGGKKVIGDLPKCQVLRVLDLEECDDLDKDDIKDIDKLWHLKYLSLGPNFDELPKKVDRLHSLEMLDLRKTKIDTIPVAVIKLHRLAHLLGKFKLDKSDWEKSMVDKFFEKKESNLETLAGFVTDGNPGFPMLMAHMKKLNRVKIWCDSVGKDNVAHMKTAIKMFVEARLVTCSGDQSLSLYLGKSSNDILSSIWDDGDFVTGYLTSLKLDGALSGLTKFARLLIGLKELCLSSTNGLTNNELTNLHMLKELKYLKLVNVDLAGFEIKKGHFPKMLCLCLVQCHGSVPTIRAEALPCLESLWIIDKELVGLSEIRIENHKHLQEVALDSSVAQKTITSWDKAAKKHPKRPKVLFFKCDSSNRTGSMVKYVATERPDRRIESNSVEQLSSNLVRVSFGDANSEEAVAAGRPLASIELHGAMDIDVASSSRVMT